MFELTYTTPDSKRALWIIDEQLAYQFFNNLIKAIDAESVTLCDGFTGEVVMDWQNGKFLTINRITVA